MGKRILVIGGLAAGPSAASKAARHDPHAEVILFEQGEHVSYGLCEVPYYIAGDVRQEGLVAYTPERLREKKRIDVRILHRVESIRPAQRTITVRDMRSGAPSDERYDRLILATGSKARSLGVQGEDARNVFHVKSLDEGVAIRKWIEEEKPRNAVIIGGGYIGMEMADALRRHGMDVVMLHRSSLPMAGLERETREQVREELERNGVQFVAHAHTEGFAVDAKGRVTHVVTKDGPYEADLVILSLGVEPNSTLATDAGIRAGTSGGIVTDERQLTTLDMVYAAGDCCEVKNLVTGKRMYLPLATIASKAGWTAGENAAGGNAVFRGAIRAIAVKVFDLEVVQVGISAEEATEAGFDVVTETVSAWSKVAVMPGSAKLTIKVIADRKSGRLLGANLFGAQGAVLRANTLAVAIQQRITIREMQQWDLAYSPPFTPLWDPLLVAANVTARKLS